MGCFQHSPVPAFTPSSFTLGPTFPLGLTPSHSTLGELLGPKCPIGHGVPRAWHTGDLARAHVCVSAPAIQVSSSLSLGVPPSMDSLKSLAPARGLPSLRWH